MLLDEAARNAALRATLGDDRASGVPAAFGFALFTGDPTAGGIELDNAVGEYQRATYNNDDTLWPDAPADGAVTSAEIVFATSTDAWTAGAVAAVATWWVAFDDADGTTRWDCGPLESAIDVDGPGIDVSIFATVVQSS